MVIRQTPQCNHTVVILSPTTGYPHGSFILGTSNPTFLHLKKSLLHISKLLHAAQLAGAAGKVGAGEGKGWHHCGILGICAVIVHLHSTLQVVACRARGDGSFSTVTFWCPSACLCCCWMVAPMIHPASSCLQAWAGAGSSG
jgi:hypothetical protein